MIFVYIKLLATLLLGGGNHFARADVVLFENDSKSLDPLYKEREKCRDPKSPCHLTLSDSSRGYVDYTKSDAEKLDPLRKEMRDFQALTGILQGILEELDRSYTYCNRVSGPQKKSIRESISMVKDARASVTKALDGYAELSAVQMEAEGTDICAGSMLKANKGFLGRMMILQNTGSHLELMSRLFGTEVDRHSDLSELSACGVSPIQHEKAAFAFTGGQGSLSWMSKSLDAVVDTMDRQLTALDAQLERCKSHKGAVVLRKPKGMAGVAQGLDAGFSDITGAGGDGGGAAGRSPASAGKRKPFAYADGLKAGESLISYGGGSPNAENSGARGADAGKSYITVNGGASNAKEQDRTSMLPESEFIKIKTAQTPEQLKDKDWDAIEQLMEKLIGKAVQQPLTEYSATVSFETGGKVIPELSVLLRLRLDLRGVSLYPFSFSGALTNGTGSWQRWDYPEIKPPPGLAEYLKSTFRHVGTGRYWLEFDLRYFLRAGEQPPPYSRVIFEAPFGEASGWRGRFKLFDDGAQKWVDGEAAWMIR